MKLEFLLLTGIICTLFGHFRVDCQKPAKRNHAKIRNHRRTIARDVTDRTLFIIFHFISENEIIYILMYFIETRQLGLEPESARKDKLQTRSPTNYLYVL